MTQHSLLMLKQNGAASATAIALAAFMVHPAALASCGAAFCSVNSDWTAAAVGLGDGSSLDVRYEYVRQDQPMSGTHRVGVGQIKGHHDEVRSTNQNLLLNYSRNFASGWGYSLVLPVVDRDHSHIHNHRGVPHLEQWSFRELGDVRVAGRFQQALGNQEHGARTGGVIFGLKLPTGRTGVANDVAQVAERSLQPGTGTTDAVVGAFYHQNFARDMSSWFAQVQYQHPLNSYAGYTPGRQLTADLGYAHSLTGRLSALVQLNIVAKRRDRGAQAEPANSGSHALFLSPGMSVDVNDKVRAYAFYQHRLYQRVNGVQLSAKGAVTLGLTTRF